MSDTIPPQSRQGSRRAPWTLVFLGVLALACALELGLASTTRGPSPRPSEWAPAELAPTPGVDVSAVAVGILETIEIAYLGTLLGAVLALPLATAAARNLSPRPVHGPARLMLGVLQALPGVLWTVAVVFSKR